MRTSFMDGPFLFCGEFARLASTNSSRNAIFPSFVTSLWPSSSALIRKKMRDRLSDYVSCQRLAMLWLITVPVQWSMPCPKYQSIYSLQRIWPHRSSSICFHSSVLGSSLRPIIGEMRSMHQFVYRHVGHAKQG